MQHILYLDTAKQLNIAASCLAVVDQQDQPHLIHPNDLLAIIIENTYCQVTLPALLLCVEQQIPVIICNAQHQPQIYCIDYYRHTELLQKLTEQLHWTEHSKKTAWLNIIHHKLQHQIQLLQSLDQSLTTIEKIQHYQHSLQHKDLTEQHINAAEASSAKLYFSQLFGTSFKRFAEDATNSALNYGYSLIRALIMVALTVKGLHPALGIWHHSIRNRFNLADDLIEILRPLVDQHVKQMNLKPDEAFSKEHRQHLLTLLYCKVNWQQNSYYLKTAIELYINDFIQFMNQKHDTITPITLVFKPHEPY